MPLLYRSTLGIVTQIQIGCTNELVQSAPLSNLMLQYRFSKENSWSVLCSYLVSVKRGRHPTTTQTSDITRSFRKTQPTSFRPAEITNMSPKDATVDGTPLWPVSRELR